MRQGIRTAPAFILMLMLLFGCAAGPSRADTKFNDTGNKSTYAPLANKSTADGTKDIGYTYYSSPLFLIYYPQGWDLEDRHSTGAFIFTAPPDHEEDKVLEQFIIEVWTGNESSPAEYTDYEMSLSTGKDIITKKETAKYKGRDAFVLEIECPDPDNGIQMFYKTTYFRNGEWVYRLHYAVEKGKLDKYRPIMESILDKFVIGDY